ncbi:MAG: hypothetical protein JSW49_05910 [candidate division WOR-3 bacterium]|nr:MAG: hypothetical protein JSW49_05910 [candidate division WOR-3 bacterium]
MKKEAPEVKLSNRFRLSAYAALLFLGLLLPCSMLTAVEVPLEFYGRGFFGKYLNSDTSRFNFDASVDIYCTTLRHLPFSMYIYYRDDLDMAQQTGGVSIDPRYAHYYLAAGIDYFFSNYVVTAYFVHDCIHDIDYDVEGTPVFNRFRLRFSPRNYHYSTRLESAERFLYAIDVGFYPHWNFHGWDINAGADYVYDCTLETRFNILAAGPFGLDTRPTFTIARGDTSFYHRHVLSLQCYHKKATRRIGLSLDYNLYVNDPLKSPDKLWLLSIYLEY